VIERLLRVYRASQRVVILSVTIMKPDVYSIEFAKEGVLEGEYKEGQVCLRVCLCVCLSLCLVKISLSHVSYVLWCCVGLC
jgi:hypothetical protein